MQNKINDTVAMNAEFIIINKMMSCGIKYIILYVRSVVLQQELVCAAAIYLFPRPN